VGSISIFGFRLARVGLLENNTIGQWKCVTIRTDLRNVLVMVASSLCFLWPVSSIGGEQIRSTKLILSLPTGEFSKKWAENIEDERGLRKYTLYFYFKPSLGARRQLDGVELRMTKNLNSKDENLLAPIRDWHGLERFLFMAWDLSHGPEQSTFGNPRHFIVKKLDLAIDLCVSEVNVTGSEPGYYTLNKLQLTLNTRSITDLATEMVSCRSGLSRQ
jgi:hypothetical protein